MDPLLPPFREAVPLALADEVSRRNLKAVIARRRAAYLAAWAAVAPEQDPRPAARGARQRAVSNLYALIRELERSARATGISVHHASDAAHAVAHARRLLRDMSPRAVLYARGDVLEEVGLYEALQGDGLPVVEVDPAGYVLRLLDEPPAHPVVPLAHLSPRDLAEIWQESTGGHERPDPASLVRAIRRHLRPTFSRAEVGVAAATFGVAETGTLVFVDEAGHTALTAALTQTLIVLMPIDRVVASTGDLGPLLEVLARSRAGDSAHRHVMLVNGPGHGLLADEVHLILVDNGRSRWAEMGVGEALTCIGCGACADVCPVFREVGGQAYNSPYMGPIGAVISPLLWPETHGDIPFAAPRCSACAASCPVGIDLPDLVARVRVWVEEQRGLGPGGWGRVWRRLVPVGRRRVPMPEIVVPTEAEPAPTSAPRPGTPRVAALDASAPPIERLRHVLAARGVEVHHEESAVAARLHLLAQVEAWGAEAVVGWEDEVMGVPGLADALAAVGRRFLGPETAWRGDGRLSPEWFRAEVGIVAASAALADTGTLLIAGEDGRPLALGVTPRTLVVVVPASRVFPSWGAWAQEGWRGNGLFLAGPGRVLAVAGLPVEPGLSVERIHVLLVGEWEGAGGGRWESNPPRPSL